MLDDGLAVFANWQTLLLGITIYVTTAFVRRVIETAWKGAKDNKWYYEVLLPIGPIANGVLLALLLKSFPWPEPIAASRSGKVMYALVCGLFCGWLYARVRGFFRQGQASGPDDGLNPTISLPSVTEEPAKGSEGSTEEVPSGSAEEKSTAPGFRSHKRVPTQEPKEENSAEEKPSDAPVS